MPGRRPGLAFIGLVLAGLFLLLLWAGEVIEVSPPVFESVPDLPGPRVSAGKIPSPPPTSPMQRQAILPGSGSGSRVEMVGLTLSGRVLDANDGLPLAGARVKVGEDKFSVYSEDSIVGRHAMTSGKTNGPFPEARTDPAGLFALQGLDPRRPWAVTVTSPGRAQQQVPAFVDWDCGEGPAFRAVVIRLARAREVAGVVVSAADGCPIPGVEVHLQTEGDWIMGEDDYAYLISERYLSTPQLHSTLADEAGRFAFAGLDPRLAWRLSSTGRYRRQKRVTPELPCGFHLSALVFFKAPPGQPLRFAEPSPLTLKLTPIPCARIKLLPGAQVGKKVLQTIRLRYLRSEQKPWVPPRLVYCGIPYLGPWPRNGLLQVPLWDTGLMVLELEGWDADGLVCRGRTNTLAKGLSPAITALPLIPVGRSRREMGDSPHKSLECGSPK